MLPQSTQCPQSSFHPRKIMPLAYLWQLHKREQGCMKWIIFNEGKWITKSVNLRSLWIKKEKIQHENPKPWENISKIFDIKNFAWVGLVWYGLYPLVSSAVSILGLLSCKQPSTCIRTVHHPIRCMSIHNGTILDKSIGQSPAVFVYGGIIDEKRDIYKNVRNSYKSYLDSVDHYLWRPQAGFIKGWW